MDPQPPKKALNFLRWFCREDYIEEIEGDLIEVFELQYEQAPRRAKWSFIWQVLRYFRPEFMKSFQNNPLIFIDMYKSYFKIAWRSLFKQKLYSFINIGGLAIGLSCFILIFLYVQHELSYDQYLGNSDQIHRVYQKMPGVEFQGTEYWAYTTVGLAPAMVEDFPEVEHATTLRDQTALLSYDNNNYYEDGLRADVNYFQVFNHPFLYGDPVTALATAESIVLTESLARKFFGNKNPIGESIIYQNGTPFTVTGVIEDVPTNASLKLSFLTSMLYSSQYAREIKENPWNNNDYYTFFTLAEGSNLFSLQSKFPDFVETHWPDYANHPIPFSYFAQPLSELHFENNLAFDIGFKGNPKYISMFSLVALLVLLLACINYMNLAIARSIKRGTEVGLRKVVGARRSQLIGQFLGESVLIACLAMMLALGLTYILSPIFGQLLERPIELNLLDNIWLLPGLLFLVLVVGIASGSYPAFLMSSLRPVQVLKGKIEGQLSGFTIQRWLTVAQYSVSIILIISSLVIYQQFQFIQDRELGYNKEHVLTISILDWQLPKHINQLKEEWLKNPNVVAVTTAAELPTNVTSSTRIRHANANEDDYIPIYRARHGYDYVDVFGLNLIAGRDFSQEAKTDFQEAIIINETAAKALGWTPEEAIGKPLKDHLNRTVIGVVKDFHMHSMHQEIAPLMLVMEEYFESIALKIQADNLPQTIATLEKSIKQHSPYPFEYQFLDDRFDQLYKAELKLGEMFGFFTLLSIIIASLGLFGLAAFVASQRTKEIGIRKILGASWQSLVGMLSKDFLKLVLFGFLLAIPIAWYTMDGWLQDFAYRIELEWWMFALSGLGAIVIAFFTVGSQSLKAAFGNPVDALSSE